MRIIAGSLKGRKLLTPTTDAIRPTSDRMREAVFNVLMHGQFGGAAVIGQRVMDICCGTGAFGLEAISRGAAHCSFIDQDRNAIDLTRQNAEHCGVTAKAHCIQADASRLPPTREPVALAFMDAPYASPLTVAAYTSLRTGGWLVQDSLFLVGAGKDQPRDRIARYRIAGSP